MIQLATFKVFPASLVPPALAPLSFYEDAPDYIVVVVDAYNMLTFIDPRDGGDLFEVDLETAGWIEREAWSMLENRYDTYLTFEAAMEAVVKACR